MNKPLKKPSEGEIDEMTAEADDDSGWEKPVRVRRRKGANVPLPSELAARAVFFARLHRESSVEDWIKKIVAERVDIEEAAFAEAKRDLAAQ
jgi:hypothetical protein